MPDEHTLYIHLTIIPIPNVDHLYMKLTQGHMKTTGQCAAYNYFVLVYQFLLAFYWEYMWHRHN